MPIVATILLTGAWALAAVDQAVLAAEPRSWSAAGSTFRPPMGDLRTRGPAAALRAPFKPMLLSASVISNRPDYQACLPFQITPSPPLIVLDPPPPFPQSQGFSRDGTLPDWPTTEPLFWVRVYPEQGPQPSERQAFALQRLRSELPPEDQLTVETVTAIALDHQTGYEITGIVTEHTTQTPLRIHLVMLFPDPNSYVVLFGMVGQDQAEQYLPVLQATARSYRHTPIPVLPQHCHPSSLAPAFLGGLN